MPGIKEASPSPENKEPDSTSSKPNDANDSKGDGSVGVGGLPPLSLSKTPSYTPDTGGGGGAKDTQTQPLPIDHVELFENVDTDTRAGRDDGSGLPAHP